MAASPAPSDERLLPSPQDFEIAEYAMGTYLSELDVIETRVTKELGPISIEEYVRIRDAGLEDVLEGPDVTDEELLELIAFTADALHDAESIREVATAIQTRALAQLCDRRNPGPGPEWEAYRGRIRRWHRDRAARGL